MSAGELFTLLVSEFPFHGAVKIFDLCAVGLGDAATDAVIAHSGKAVPCRAVPPYTLTVLLQF